MLGARCTRWTVLRETVPNVGHLKYSKVVLTECLTIPKWTNVYIRQGLGRTLNLNTNKSISWGVTKLIWRSIHRQKDDSEKLVRL
jgi:hypothetical protein